MRRIREYQLKLTVYGVKKPENEGGYWEATEYSEQERGMHMLSEELVRKIEQEMIDNFVKCAVPVELSLTVRQANSLDRLTLIDKIKNLVKRK
jgi:hypothetical protein